MFYIIYKTTCLINSKIYIGYHSTNNLDDGYLGSGTHLKKAIKKYGVINFKREIIHLFNSKKEALNKEAEIVNEDFIKRDDTFNIKCGGEGGWEHTWHDKRRLDAITKSFKEGRSKGWQQSSEQRTKLRSGKNNGFYGKTHTKETKNAIKETLKLDQKIIDLRLTEYNAINKSRGWITKLAKSWNISHTQVKRFLKLYNNAVLV